jgi:hypothetical protein
MKGVLIYVLLLGLSFVVGTYDGIEELDLPETGFVTRAEAMVAINNSEGIIERMRENNFSVVGVSNDLVEAKEVFRLVDYSEVLRNASATAEERWEAVRALEGVDWRYLDYGDVFAYTDDIVVVGYKAFLSYDSLILAKVIYEEYKEKGILDSDSEGVELISRAEDAFYGERYDDAENLALMAQELMESGSSSVSFFGRVKNEFVGFFRAYWIYVLILLAFVVGIFYRKIVGIFRGE